MRIGISLGVTKQGKGRPTDPGAFTLRADGTGAYWIGTPPPYVYSDASGVYWTTTPAP